MSGSSPPRDRGSAAAGDWDSGRAEGSCRRHRAQERRRRRDPRRIDRRRGRAPVSTPLRSGWLSERHRHVSSACWCRKWSVRSAGRVLIVGLTRDPTFGPVWSASAWAASRSRSSATSATALPPLDAFLARELIARTRVSHVEGSVDRPAGSTSTSWSRCCCGCVNSRARFLPCSNWTSTGWRTPTAVPVPDARVLVSDGPLAADATYSHLAIRRACTAARWCAR